MPYRFKIDEPVAKGFHRIAREQLDAALQELAASEVQPKAVHECRKSLKRLRALVRLVAPALGKKVARRRIKALGAIARLLADRRDQAVIMETAATLSSETGTDGSLTLAPLKTHFAKSVGDAPHPLDPVCALEARQLLALELKKFDGARLRKRGFAAFDGGLEKSYRRARRALREAYSEPSNETFHALRKSVQWHWRQMSLLARAWPEEAAVRVNAARELSQMLGDDHDLAMLIDATAKADDISPEHKDAIIGLCIRKQQTLRAAVEHPAEQLFAESTTAFVKRMRVYWKHGRKAPNVEARPIARQEALQFQTALTESSVIEAIKRVTAKPRLAAKAATAKSSQSRT
ncbi:MAG TPA: CHAD domain-containing protein [Hyphomicrobium sp.]|nr:CHAD domain-containing protein [Hyphomicrobium sp.]